MILIFVRDRLSKHQGRVFGRTYKWKQNPTTLDLMGQLTNQFNAR